MHGHVEPATLDRLIQPLSDCLTIESAQRLVKMKADPKLQARVDRLAAKCSAGTLTQKEREEYRGYVSFGTFIDILKSKARLLLAQPRSKP
jgi:hypothetical protein